jgi:hypothetical protein
MRIRSAPALPDPTPAGRPGRLCASGALLVACLVAGPVPAALAADPLPDGVVWTAMVNDRNVEATSTDDAVELDPRHAADVVVRLENRTDETVEIPAVRLRGEVLELPLYSYTTQVALVLPPGATDERSFSIPLFELETQASGLIPSRISLLDGDAQEISGIDLTVDVRGEATSVYGVFGAAIGAVTLLLLAGALLRLATGRLPVNRWRRALVFAAPGLGLGFLVTFTLSALRVATPEGSLWTSLILGGGALGFLAGYLSPTPSGPGHRDGDTDGDPHGEAEDGAPVEGSHAESDGEPDDAPAWLDGLGRGDDEDADEGLGVPAGPDRSLSTPAG